MPTLYEVLESYKRSLLASVQLQEFRSWGGTMSAAFSDQIAAHVQIEKAYIAEQIAARKRDSAKRERGDHTRFGMPPSDEAWPVFPHVLPWDREICDLAAFWLEVQCSCARTTFVPLRRLAGDIGWKKTLREIVPKLRCSRPGCKGVPALVLLINSASAERRKPGSRAQWFQLVPAGDEQVFPRSG